MKRQKAVQNLLRDGWTLEAALAAVRTMQKYERTFPLRLADLGHKLMILMRVA
jgi:hypothetical protein